MTSDLRLTASLGLAALAAIGCGPGLSDLDRAGADPLVTLEVQVDLADLEQRYPQRYFYAALVWGESWENPAICHVAAEDPLVRPTCRSDPLALVPGRIETMLPLDTTADGRVRLEVKSLPPISFSVGDKRGRVAYGSVVVFASLDVDADLHGSQDGPVDPEFLQGQSVPEDAEVVQATFVTMAHSHTRLVFREGDFRRDSYFYPYPTASCGVPPLGFSILHVVGDWGQQGCSFAKPSETLNPSAVDPTAVSLPCDLMWFEDPHAVWEPLDEPFEFSLEGDNYSCVRPDILVHHAPKDELANPRCVALHVWALAACHRNLLCAAPDWDHRLDPPAWWPCN